MIDKFAGRIRGIGSYRTGLDSYFANVQERKCRYGPKYEEARKDFNNRLRGEVHGYLGR